MTIATEGGSVAGWTIVSFTPRRAGETVGALVAQNGEFVFNGSANLDIPETIEVFWEQAEAALKEQTRAAVLAKQVEGMKP